MSEAPRDLVTLVQRATTRHASRPMFAIDRDGAWAHVTFADLARQEVRLRAALARLGVRAGDRVAVISKNREEWPVVLAATHALGAAIVPMYEMQHEDDWRHILRDAKARVCFASTDAIYGRIRAMLGDLPDLAHVVGLDRGPVEHADDTSFRHLIEDAHAGDAPLVIPDPGDVAAFIYTSGTTGKPKGVKLSHHAIAFEMNALGDEWNLGPEDRTVSILPWAHVGGFCELILGIDRGSCTAVPSAFDKLADAMRATRPTIIVAVPRVWNALYDAIQKGMAARPPALRWVWDAAISAEKKRRAGIRPKKRERAARRLARRVLFPAVRAKLGGELRYAVSGAAALSKEIAELFECIGIPMFEVYGQTETGAVSTANRPGQTKLGTVGRPLRGVRIEIDRTVGDADDGSGEIIIHTPGAMLGYHGLAGETASVLRDDGAIRTGDLGRLDSDGYLVITGRLREVYKLENGKFVTPVPLEEGLTLSPFISQALVWGWNKPHNVALLVVDTVAVKKWCEANGVRESASALDDNRVRDLFKREIEERTRGCKGYERIEAFALIAEPFTPDNGMLTPTLKLKRSVVLARHRERIDALYA
jgi:long-chain acyl-CoA synthetase